MKIKNILSIGLLSASALMVSCIDEDMNKDPRAVGKEQLKPEWSLNASISGAQMDPHLGERVFVLAWKAAARFDRTTSGLALGADVNEYMTDYIGISWGAGWLRDANLAVQIAQDKIDSGEAEADAYPYYKNMLQISRIWRAYLLAEFADNFGPMPIEKSFIGENPVFENQETVYKFILSELENATKSIDTNINMSELTPSLDLFYGGNMNAWIKYGNSLRMRMAMRISEADPALAQQHFEDAAKIPYIQTQADIAQVVEQDGWSNFTGVMSRTWNGQAMSKTYNNLVVGLGNEEFSVPSALTSKVKDPRTYLGKRLDRHFPLTTNDPSAGYFFDGIPKYVDPRAAVLYHITGYRDTQGIYPAAAFGDAGDAAVTPENFNAIKFLDTQGEIELTLDITHTWSAAVGGIWDRKGTMSTDYIRNRNFPSLSNVYRMSTNKRVFFGPWESYFLLAEAKLKGWNVPGTVKENYEKGIAASFDYHGLTGKLAAYLASNDYNRVGTSVNFDHTTEATSYTISYVDGYTKENKTTTYEYPKNSIYKGGAVNNDALTKIITQKYLAQVPWLPLEAWSDHRRLGLPFFENPAAEVAYDTQTQVPLTPENSKTCSWDFYPQRTRFPSTWQTIDPSGFSHMQSLIGGPDKSTTPLWWAHQR